MPTPEHIAALARALVPDAWDDNSDGLTQAFYDDMTRPWRSIVGPIHPDDAPLNARAEREGVQR